MKKQIHKKFAFILATGILVSTLLIPAKSVLADTNMNNERTITVTGNSTLEFAPDVAYVELGIVTKNIDATAAQTENNTKTNAVISALETLGVTKLDVKTSMYNLNKEYNYKESSQEFIGYSVRNNFTITVKDLNKVGTLIDTAIKNGADISNGVRFECLDTRNYYNEALILAIREAKQKANSIASELGIVLENPSTVIENSTNYNIYNGMTLDSSAERDFKSDFLIVPGELSINANVVVTYKY